MEKEKYNGWTNYATWRVNLELIDGTQFVHEDIASAETEIDIPMIADFLKDSVVGSQLDEARYTVDHDKNNTIPSWILDYADAFLSEVNWYEIAKHIAEDNPEMLKAY